MTPEHPGPRPAPLRSRRDEVITSLTTAFAQDDISVEEFERRLDVAHRASDLAELDALLADLRSAQLPVPAAAPALAPAPAQPPPVPFERREHETMVAIMGGVERRGPWTPARRNQVFVLMGGVELDLREARLPPGSTQITIVCAMGGVSIIVPPGMIVDVSGIAIMGGFARRSPPPAEPSAPILHVKGLVLMGGVDIQVRNVGESARDAHRRERAERKRLRRGGA